MTRDELFEELASIEHERWSRWQKYMHSLCYELEAGDLVIPASRVKHWERQITTPYADLSEKEKNYDRDEVKRYWHLVEPNEQI